LALIFPIVTFSFLARGIYRQSADSSVLVEALTRYYISYSSGHLFGFSDWFNFYTGDKHFTDYTQYDTSYGFYTFMSIFRWFGDTRYVPQGVFDEYYDYGPYIFGNVYSLYRALIIDFGLIGSIVAMMVLGTIFHLAFRNLLLKRFAVLSVSIFITMMGFIYTSFIASVFIWDSTYAMPIGLAAVLYANVLFGVDAGRSQAVPPRSGSLDDLGGLRQRGGEQPHPAE
jgi:oligosaccharide repeat unit polymerase